jgi:hypothetical protein
LDPEKDKNFPARVLARLIQSEAHEPDVWLRDDYRQAFITLDLALKGNTMPFVVASYQMYGLHPDKVWPARIARRKALLGKEYEAIAGEPALPLVSPLPGSPNSQQACGKHDPIPQGAVLLSAGVDRYAPASPRKPVQSVRPIPKRRAA